MKFIQLLFVKFILVSFCHQSISQQINFHLTEELVIGNDENASEEYLFNRITHICTDSNGNVYVAENKMLKVRVFDETGKFIKSVGRRGQGPGEILEITCMTVDHRDDLIVVDRMNRRFTRFSNIGDNFSDSAKTFTFLSEINPDLFAISSLANDTYVLYFRKKSSKNRTVQPDDKVLHIINHDFSKILDSFAQAEDIWNFEEQFERSIVGAPLICTSLSTIDSTNIIFSPHFYDGKLICYKFRNGIWDLMIMPGIKKKFKPYILLNRKDYPDGKYPKNFLSVSGSEGRFLIQQQNTNAGLCILNNRKILQFSFSYYENKGKYYCELFDENGNFMGSSELKEKRFQVKWIDKNNRLYAISVSKEGYPVIKVFKLDYSIKK